MATISSLISRVRLELGDIGKTFVEQFVADGSTNRFKLHYAPLEGSSLIVYQNGIDISESCSVEESTGVLVTTDVPADGAEMIVSGTYYRYFTNAELTTLVTDAVLQHSAGHQDEVGRKITVENLPAIEEYPVSIYAVTLALYTLATDSAFDIDIQAPDGVNIPRSERYRQLMDMVNTRQAQYKELCTQLGLGMYRIDVFTFRRISKATGRFVPVYKPQEVDDRSYPQRVHDQLPSYGDKQAPWPTDGGELTAYQGRAYEGTVDFTGDFTDKSFVAYLLNQRGSVLVVQNFELSVATTDDTNFTATIALTADQTLRLAERTYWSIQSVDDTTSEKIEIKGGNFFTQRVSTVVI